MDAREFVNDYIKAEDLSKDISKPTTVKIVDSGKPVDTKYGKRLTVRVETSEKQIKQLMLNSAAVKRICDLFGSDTANWIEKSIKLVAIDKRMVVL